VVGDRPKGCWALAKSPQPKNQNTLAIFGEISTTLTTAIHEFSSNHILLRLPKGQCQRQSLLLGDICLYFPITLSSGRHPKFTQSLSSLHHLFMVISAIGVRQCPWAIAMRGQWAKAQSPKAGGVGVHNSQFSNGTEDVKNSPSGDCLWHRPLGACFYLHLFHQNRTRAYLF